MQAVSLSCPTERARGSYVRREPEKSVLHVIVREHLETFFAVVREERGKDLPYYVENELRRYLDCGILAKGFLRVVCARCGDEMLVAYWCKCRGACPSCSARRMCGSAAHLVDHVLPDVPLRQWVLTAPYEVRRVLALRPDALTAARVAGLIPPPRFPLLRLSGVLGPNAPWRAAVVVYGRGGVAAAKAAHDAPKRKRRKGKEKEDGNAAAILVDGGARRAEVPEVGDVPRSSPSRTSLGSGVVQAVGARIDWARWLRRVYLEDVLACPCGGRRRVIADLHDPEVVTALLVHLGLPTEGPAVARARDPAGCEAA